MHGDKMRGRLRHEIISEDESLSDEQTTML